jgi:hypothetical protein
MVDTIYSLCAVTAFLCSYLLLKTYYRSRYRLLLWGGLCFVMLTINNCLLILDKLVVQNYDLSLWRWTTGLAATLILLYGLIWDSE